MWHEARRSERKVHDLMDAARRRAQRRAIYLAKRRGDPQDSLQIFGSRCRMYRDDGLYQATQDHQGLIPWNGKQDILIDRFDGRALLDFIRDSNSRQIRSQEKSDEEAEVEEFVNFERYRDLIKHRRRGFSDEEGLKHVDQELQVKAAMLFMPDRLHSAQPPPSKGSYSQVGFSYDGDGNGNEEQHVVESDDDDDGEEDDEDEKDISSDDSNDEGMESIAKEFGVKRFNWLVYMDKKAKEEEKRQKEVVKGDPAIRKLSRKERRKASQIEREKEREVARLTGNRVLHHDPYRDPRRSPTYEAYSRHRRSRTQSRSRSPSHTRRYDRGAHADSGHRGKSKASTIEYITEFGGSPKSNDQTLGVSPPPSPPSQADVLNRPSTGGILEALLTDPASAVSLDQEKNSRVLPKTPVSASSAIAKLSKPTVGSGFMQQQSEKKETPQERLKRIMSKQLNKQIKKDSAAELAKKREQERQRQEKLAETSRLSRYRHHSRSRSRSHSPHRRYRHSRSGSRSRSRSRSQSRSSSRSRTPRRYRSRSHSRSWSPRKFRVRSRSRY